MSSFHLLGLLVLIGVLHLVALTLLRWLVERGYLGGWLLAFLLLGRLNLLLCVDLVESGRVHLDHSDWLCALSHQVASGIVSSPFLYHYGVDPLQLHLKLSNLSLRQANLGLGVGYLPSNHLLSTLRPDACPREGRLQ